MKSLVMALVALPFMASAAAAAQPLSNEQMDRVTAGFTAVSIADAEGLVGESGIVLTTTGSLSQVSLAGVAVMGETASALFKSVSGAASSTVTSTYSPAPVPGLH
jgi:hypothetical protein